MNKEKATGAVCPARALTREICIVARWAVIAKLEIDL